LRQHEPKKMAAVGPFAGGRAATGIIIVGFTSLLGYTLSRSFVSKTGPSSLEKKKEGGTQFPHGDKKGIQDYDSRPLSEKKGQSSDVPHQGNNKE